METLIRCCIMWHLIWVCTVCLCAYVSLIGCPNNNGLKMYQPMNIICIKIVNSYQLSLKETYQKKKEVFFFFLNSKSHNRPVSLPWIPYFHMSRIFLFLFTTGVRWKTIMDNPAHRSYNRICQANWIVISGIIKIYPTILTVLRKLTGP